MTKLDTNVTAERAPRDTAFVHTRGLDTLWLQVGGTICNLRCHHCFISCSPENDSFAFMSRETCKDYVDEGIALGVREFYLTGGEPFANPDICDIVEHALTHGPTTILTNATLFRDGTLERLDAAGRTAAHALEVRVSLDGFTAAMNDPIRGEGTFDRAMAGVRRLVACALRPIITITRTWAGDDADVLAGFVALLEGAGYAQPRLKVLPALRLGAETRRTHGYGPEERVTAACMDGFDESQLLCSTSRIATARGVWVCPILIDSPRARMGDSLAETIRDHPLDHAACFTCRVHGAICSNATTGTE